jgi:hypothetical protein
MATTKPPAAKAQGQAAGQQDSEGAKYPPNAVGEQTSAAPAVTNPFSVPPAPPNNPNDPQGTLGTSPPEGARVRTSADLWPTVVPAQVRAYQDAPDSRRKMIDALVDERAGYEQRTRGDDDVARRMRDRMKSVDESLSALGTSYDAVIQERQERRDRTERGERQPEDVDPNRKMIDALVEEREGYVQANQPDRVAAVDESLRRLGVTPEQAAREREARQKDRGSQPAVARTQAQQER